MDPRKVIFLLGLTPLCVLAQAPDVKSGIEHLQKLDSMFIQNESVVVKSSDADKAVKAEVSGSQIVSNKNNSSELDLDSFKQGSLKQAKPEMAPDKASVQAASKDTQVSMTAVKDHSTVNSMEAQSAEELSLKAQTKPDAKPGVAGTSEEVVSAALPKPPEITVESVKSSESPKKDDPKQIIAEAKSGMGSSEHKREVKVTASPEKKKVLLIAKKSVKKQSVKPKTIAAASSGGTLRDQNGAVDRVHNGLDDVTAADLAASKTLQPSLPKSPWEDEVREIASYNANRPPLPDGRSNPSISALSAEFGDRVPTSPRRPVTPRRNYDLSRKMTVFSRKDSFNVATQAPSQNEINEKRLLETAPQSGSARIPDVSGLVRN